MKYWDWSRLVCCAIAGAFIGSICSLPLILGSAIFDDTPDFWLWPAFSIVFTILLFFGGACEDGY